MVGVTNTVIDMAAYLLFTRVFGVFYLLANILAFIISSTNSYFLNRIFTFKSSQNKKMEYSLFLTILLIGLGLAEIILYFCVSQLGASDIIAKCTAIIIVLFWNFFGSKFFVFKVKKGLKIFSQ